MPLFPHAQRRCARSSRFKLTFYGAMLTFMLAGLLALAFEPPSASAATLTVNTCNYNTLKTTINSAAAGDTINFGCSGTITFTSQIIINKSLTIDGSGQNIIFDGSNATCFFQINGGLAVAVTLNKLTFQNGRLIGTAGAIFNTGTLTITNSSFSNNMASGGATGGAIANAGTLTITDSSFNNNSAPGGTGGAIANGSKLILNNTTFTGNSSNVSGGAVYNSGTLTADNSTFSNNSAPLGNAGAIYSNGPTLTLTGSTFNGNSSRGNGGAIASNNLTITGSTFSGNSTTAYSGGAISAGNLTITGSTFSGNSAAADGGAIVAFGTQSVSNSSFTNNKASVNGGAIAVGSGSLVISNNSSFSGNMANGTGGGIYTNNNPVTATNTTLSGNTTNDCNSYITNGGGSTDSDGSCFPQVVDHFLVQGYPSPVTVGTFNNFTVTAQDANNKTVKGYTGTVKFSSSDSAALLPANYTFTAADQGKKSFSALFSTVGTQSLSASDTAKASITGSQTNIKVVEEITPPPPPAGTPGYASDPKPGGTLSMGAKYGNAARKSLVVSEVGEADLTISDPKITGENASEFSILSPAFPLTIADGSPAQEIVVKCSATAPGKRKAVLTFSTNDPNQPTVSYYLMCGAEEEKKPADLVVQLRVTPDRTAKNDPASEIRFGLSVKNVGPGEAEAVRLVLPIDLNLSPAYTEFSSDQMWVSELVTDGEKPYLKVGMPPMSPNQSYSATLVFRPKGGARDGTLIREQFTAGWDDAVHAGMVSTSNSVSVTLSSEQGGRDDTKGAVMWFAQHGQKVALGLSITLTGDFYTPEEAVDFWYTDPSGNSVDLGKFWADKKGKISLEFSTNGLKEGQVYTIIGKGRRSGIMGSAAITITAADSGDGEKPKAPDEGLK